MKDLKKMQSEKESETGKFRIILNNAKVRLSSQKQQIDTLTAEVTELRSKVADQSSSESWLFYEKMLANCFCTSLVVRSQKVQNMIEFEDSYSN